TGMKDTAARVKKDRRDEPPSTYKLIDTRYLRDISLGNKEYEKMITEQFLEAIPTDIAALESALAGKDITTLRQAAHNMKTNVSVMGLSEKFQPWLDTVEHEAFNEVRFQQAISLIKALCKDALPEARHFYASL
ncbi:MAG TPA: Hpt domain-containing protein, partial [Chitinophagaceae bacterium]|nr:Hpt domain-containing protein [Chitinophagaceae bacterium]